MHPEVALKFAEITFLSDNREDLKKVKIPTLVMQCSEDIIAPPEVGQFVHENIENSTLVQLRATGHCPNLSAPEETVSVIKAFLKKE
jgi:sigma-B regulation protein RsbQ